jgi:hypothetical protein
VANQVCQDTPQDSIEHERLVVTGQQDPSSEDIEQLQQFCEDVGQPTD